MGYPYNDLQRIETPLLQCMINAYTADYGRKLTLEEVMESKKIISSLQSELDARQMQQEYRINPKL
jgi:hypothetical protein